MRDTNKWNKENPELKKRFDRDWNYRRKFGASMMEQFGVEGIEGYEFLCNRQNRTCPLCKKTEDELLLQAEKNRKKKVVRLQNGRYLHSFTIIVTKQIRFVD